MRGKGRNGFVLCELWRKTTAERQILFGVRNKDEQLDCSMIFSFKKQRGNYTLLKRIGKGRFGVCYLAASEDGKPVVVKRLKSNLFKKNNPINVNEAVILSQIDHPAVPEILGVINEKRFYGFVLQQMPGVPLEKLLFKQKHVFMPGEIRGIGIQLIDILKYLHGHGIVHRDISISNVLIHDRNVSLVDFGLAQWMIGRKDQLVNDDFAQLGDLLLYLHYSSFVKQRGKRKPWFEELSLTKEQIHFYKRLLGLEDPYSAVDEVEKDFLAAFSAYSSMS